MGLSLSHAILDPSRFTVKNGIKAVNNSVKTQLYTLTTAVHIIFSYYNTYSVRVGLEISVEMGWKTPWPGGCGRIQDHK